MGVFEKHYQPQELAKQWGVSADTVRRMFEDEAGVLIIDRPEELHKRGYRTIRIPASVAERVHQAYLSR